MREPKGADRKPVERKLRGTVIVAARRLRRLALTALLGGLLSATMVRMGPGFGIDEREFDARLSSAGVNELRAERARDANLVGFYGRYLAGLLKGDFGRSRSLNRPVAELLRERLPVTLLGLAWGASGGILLGVSLAFLTLLWRSAIFDFLGAALSSVLLSIPAAVLALLFLWTGGSGRWAIALIVFPHVYRYAGNLLAGSYASPHVTAALARGVGRTRVVAAHVLAPVAPHLAAVAGLGVNLAFGASIPVEVICDQPGIGQLTWQAALGRDMPLLVTLTMIIALITLVANGAADLALEAAGPQGTAS
jgi:ABC-type dipeptide/oligopeptide/nickel transport system permease component